MSGSSSSGPEGGSRGKGGRRGRPNRATTPKARSNASQQRGGRGGGNQQSPLEIAVRSTRKAITRHAEGLRDDQVRLGCRAVLVALHGNLASASNPGEILGMIEQTAHVVHGGDDTQLPVALRAAVAFVLADQRRTREVQQQLRLLLRHLYALSADYIPRSMRDDASFRGSALLEVVHDIAREYLSDTRFEQLRA